MHGPAVGCFCLAWAVAIAAVAADGPAPYVVQGTWWDTLVAHSIANATTTAPTRRALPDWGQGDLTAMAWIQTKSDGTILAKAPARGPWLPQGKALFVQDGRLVFDIGWVGCLTSSRSVADGQWHHVALILRGREQQLVIDGQQAAAGSLKRKSDPANCVLKIGQTSENFGGDFRGRIDDLRLVAQALSMAEIRQHAEHPPTTAATLAGYWPFDGDGGDASAGGNPAALPVQAVFTAGKFGQALQLARAGCVVPTDQADRYGAVWARLAQDFPAAASRQEMAWEQQDGIWDGTWSPGDWVELTRRYAQVAQRLAAGTGSLSSPAERPSAPASATLATASAARTAYVLQHRKAEARQMLERYDLPGLRAMIQHLQTTLGSRYPEAASYLAQLEQLEQQGLKLTDGAPQPLADWSQALTGLRRQALLIGNPLVKFDKLVFVKRHTYNANHYYTEYINATWLPGGNLCVLDLRDGSVRDVVPSLAGGVFERYDVSFDAQRIVFAWKAGPQVGYRIYEVNLDGTGLRQLTFPDPDEDALVKKYRVFPHYHHGTDDMQPCYLPDGGIAFISTRCQYGILCDSPDDFTTTVLYRLDADRQNLRKLTNSSVSEASPVILPDGRIMYTRWEYVDKGAVSVKCLWAMRPDGSASSEIYGNDIALPPTLLYGRPIPDSPHQYVVLGTPHCPQNGVGAVIRLDMRKDIRSRDPMTYMTPTVDVRAEGGFAFCQDGSWTSDGQGRGPLFKDPYPLAENLFLVAHKPAGPVWHDAKAYGLYLLDAEGHTQLIYQDPEISCWLPYPCQVRKIPRTLPSEKNAELEARHQAMCVVGDVYHGLKDVPRGTIKYIRVLEQIPRPWAARRRWPGDAYDQQHACVTKDTHLGLKVQHGIVPVEADGSAAFLVPAEANIFFQVLDTQYQAVQTERTYVNYMPGEIRSCVGCHETPNHATGTGNLNTKQALLRAPSVPGPQPGEASGRRPLDYACDVQPVWNKHCLECHRGSRREGGLDLSGELTAMFNVSYEQLVPERRKGRVDRGLLGPVIGENHPKTGNIDYLPARSLGSHASVLIAMLRPAGVQLQDPAQAERVRKLGAAHKDVKLSTEELLRVTNWVDTNCQYYGTYWGRKNLQYRNRPDFRPVPTFEMSTRMDSPFPDEG